MPSRSQYALSGIRAGTETCPYDHTNLRFFNWYAKPKFTANVQYRKPPYYRKIGDFSAKIIHHSLFI